MSKQQSRKELNRIQQNLLKENIDRLTDWIFERMIMTMFIKKGKTVPKLLIAKIKELSTELLNLGITESSLGLTWKLNSNKSYTTEAHQAFKEGYNEYKKSQKYFGDTIVKETTVLTPAGEMGKNCVSQFNRFVGQKGSAKAFTWHQQLEEWNWCDDEDLKDQFKLYYRLVKEGRLYTQSGNNIVKELNGKKWYSLVVQHTDGGNVCVGSIKLFKYHVSGLVYWFSNESNRDVMFKYLKGK